MLDILRSLKSLVKVSRTRIDNEVFRLHYTFTVLILLTFCIVVTTKQYVGDPIDCIHNKDIPSNIINTYCWIHTTYTIPSAFYKKVGKEVPHPGIDSTQDEESFRYHKYYQWVCFMLFLQATFFYTPRWLWRMWEGGKIQALMMDLDVGMLGEQEKKQKKKLLVDYLLSSWKTHDWYAGRYLICEIMAFSNVLGQMFLLDRFFDGEFMNYGLQVVDFLNLDPEERVDPMVRIFPRVTKCRFHKYGPSANLETYDALCVMPLNIINEKIYIFLWFWFVILSVLSGFVLIFHAVVFACPPVRVYVLSMRYRFAHMENLHTLVRKGSFGDWFLIYMLGQNVDAIIFKELVVELSKKVTSEPKEGL